jgi:hypothetical protein
MNIFLYFVVVGLALFAWVIAIVLVARATKVKPKPIKPIWAVLMLCLSILPAGFICSYFGGNIHILYWWLLGSLIATLLLPLFFIFANLWAHLFATTLVFIFHRPRRKK